MKHHITQNVSHPYRVDDLILKVDSLLQRALVSLGSFTDSEVDAIILELHGTLRYAICLHCHERTLRTQLQVELQRLNPRWGHLLMLNERDIKINADGDVDLRASSLGSDDIYEYRSFRYPPCPVCLSQYGDTDLLRVDSDGAWIGGSTGILKPAVIFFGENVSDEVRNTVNNLIDTCDQVLVVGTTLAVLSAQRLVRAAKTQGKRIAIMTSGYVRNEEALVQDTDIRIWWRSSEVFEHIASLSNLRDTFP